MNAYTVVGPTNVQPRRLRSFESADGSRSSCSSVRSVSLIDAPRAGRAVRLPAPEVGRERSVLGDDRTGAARVVDGRLDLAAMPHDAGILEQPFDARRRESCDGFDLETRRTPRGRRRVSGGWSASSGPPGNPRGRSSRRGGDRPRRAVPTRVVVGAVVVAAGAPRAAGATVGAGGEPDGEGRRSTSPTAVRQSPDAVSRVRRQSVARAVARA